MTGIQARMFDPILHSGPRITIMSRMLIHQRMRFSALQKATGLTSGNLASHTEVLAKAGYLRLDLDDSRVEKRKTIHLMPRGDAAFRAYVQQMQALLADVERDLPAAATPTATEAAPVDK